MLSRPSPSLHTPVISHCVLLRLHDYVFNTLIDTGSTISFIDHAVVQSMNINIIPSSGVIQLASSSHSLPRVGVTPPLSFTPVVVQGTLQQLTPRTHTFEVMPLSTHKYQFILGMDLLRMLFPSQIPTSLLPDDDNTSSSATSMSAPTSSLIHTPIPMITLRFLSSATFLIVFKVVLSLVNLM